MVLVIKAFGILIALLSLAGMARPDALAGLVTRTMHQPWGLAYAVVIRLALGALFIYAAPQTAHPAFFVVLGYLMLAAAVLIVLMGRARLLRLIEFVTGQGPAKMRAWLLLGLAFGLAIAWLA